jgi:hypothetical protein
MIVIHLPRINVLRASNTWTKVQSNSHGNSSAMTTAIFYHSICSSATNLERKTSCEKSCQLSYRPTTYYWPPLKFVHRSYRNLLSYWIGLSILNKRKLKRINPSKHHCRNYNEELNLLQEPELVDPMIQTFPPRHHSGFRWPHNPQSPRVTLLSLEIGLQETHTWRLVGFQATYGVINKYHQWWRWMCWGMVKWGSPWVLQEVLRFTWS